MDETLVESGQNREPQGAPVSPPAAGTAQGTPSGEQSWGDKYKKFWFNKGTYVGINYFINALISTVVTYVVENKYAKNINQFCSKFGKFEKNAFGVSRTFLITSGGNSLVFALKGLEDHRQRLEFGIGHMLDKLQETLGRGNSASKQNIADYGKIKAALKSGQPLDATDAEKARWHHQYRLQTDESGKASFQEHKLSWSKAFLSRAGAFASALVLNAGIIGSLKKLPESNPVNYNTFTKNKASPWITKFILNPIGLGKRLDAPSAFSEIMFNEAVSTLSSSIPHRLIQNRLHKDLPDDGWAQDQASGAETNSAIQKIVAGGPRDRLARDSETGLETAGGVARHG